MSMAFYPEKKKNHSHKSLKKVKKKKKISMSQTMLTFANKLKTAIKSQTIIT